MLIGSITQNHWNAGACGGGGGGAQGYTVSIAPAHGQLHLVGKRLRLTATLVNGSPTIYFGTATYLDTPSYYVCTIGGGGGGTLPGTGTQPRATTSVPDSFTTGGKPLNPHDPQSPNITNTVVYLHGDHLGSISVVTNQSGGVVSSQSYDPWGKVRSQTGISQTKLNYTGQRLDDTGLLYYHARYYDPVLGRFTSPDTNVSGAAGLAVTSVTKGDKKAVPANPQSLGRYTYTLNNPQRYIDVSGHEPQTPTMYHNMAGLTYAHMMQAMISKTFTEILLLNTMSQVASRLGGGGNGLAAADKLAAYTVFNGKIGGDGSDWDMKQYLHKTIAGSDFHGPKDTLYVHIPGTASNEHSNFNVFGNVYYGYLGMAAGFNEAELLGGGAFADAIKLQFNDIDQSAITLGINLWKKYGATMTEEQFEEAISQNATNVAHTCKTDQRCE